MLGKHWLGSPHLKRECGASLNARELTREKGKLIWARISNPNTVQVDCFPQVKYTCVDLGRAKSSIFKKLGKYWLRSLHLKRECGTSLDALELMREKKVDMGKDLSPYEGTQMTSTVSIYSLFFFLLIL